MGSGCHAPIQRRWQHCSGAEYPGARKSFDDAGKHAISQNRGLDFLPFTNRLGRACVRAGYCDAPAIHVQLCSFPPRNEDFEKQTNDHARQMLHLVELNAAEGTYTTNLKDLIEAVFHSARK